MKVFTAILEDVLVRELTEAATAVLDVFGEWYIERIRVVHHPGQEPYAVLDTPGGELNWDGHTAVWNPPTATLHGEKELRQVLSWVDSLARIVKRLESMNGDAS